MMTVAAMLAALLLAGCAAGSDDKLASLMVAPGKYEFYKCPDLIAAMQKTAARERQLQGLMVKAGPGVGGRLVSATVYRPNYLSARGNMNDLRQAMRAKHCELPPDATATPQPSSSAVIH